MLTKEQEQFVQALVKNGGKKGPAYRAVFPDVTVSSASTLGCRMFKNVDVQLRYEELLKQSNIKAKREEEKQTKQREKVDEQYEDAVTDMRAKLIAFYIDVMEGRVYNENQGMDKDSGSWVVTSRSVKASDRIAAAEKLSKLYGIEEQPAEEIKIELVCGAEELAN